MTNKSKLRLCNWALPFLAVFILLSSLHLEATACRSTLWVWLHVAVGSLFFAFVLWHLRLHFPWGRWGSRLLLGPKRAVRWLTLFGLLALLSAMAATLFRLVQDCHSVVGGIHGKLGFVFLVLAVAHALVHHGYYRKSRL